MLSNMLFYMLLLHNKLHEICWMHILQILPFRQIFCLLILHLYRFLHNLVFLHFRFHLACHEQSFLFPLPLHLVFSFPWHVLLSQLFLMSTLLGLLLFALLALGKPYSHKLPLILALGLDEYIQHDPGLFYLLYILEFGPLVLVYKVKHLL